MKVLLRTDTTNYIKHGKHALKDVGKVSFNSYDIDETEEVLEGEGRARIVIRERDDPMIQEFSPKTRFNVLHSTETVYTPEMGWVPGTYDTFSIYKTETLWENLDFSHELNLETDYSLTLFRPL